MKYLIMLIGVIGLAAADIRTGCRLGARSDPQAAPSQQKGECRCSHRD